jgi:hypothetical protein
MSHGGIQGQSETDSEDGFEMKVLAGKARTPMAVFSRRERLVREVTPEAKSPASG